MESLKHILLFLKDNWVLLFICIALIFRCGTYLIDVLSKPADETVANIKSIISQIMLELVTDAEKEYQNWTKAGSIKRSMVISEVYRRYPILSKIIDQDTFIQWIDEQIDIALKDMREIFKENSSTNTCSFGPSISTADTYVDGNMNIKLL